MASIFFEDGAFVNSIVGEGTFFKGQIDIEGLLRIDGDFSGSIKTGGRVLIGRQGRVESTIEAGTVVVGGVCKGNITATEKVVILSHGMMLGNVKAPRLVVEEGVVLNGTYTVWTE